MDLFFWKLIRGLVPHITSGYTDGHKVEMYVSITNTEGVMAILMISRSRGGHIGILFWKLLGVLDPLHLWLCRLPYSPNVCLYHKYRRSYDHFNDFMKWRRPYWILKKCHWTKFCTPSGKCCLRPL